MKRIFISLLAFTSLISTAFAGGIVTNTNQSAAWVRTMVRDASIDVDAVFYNPAGLTRLEDGFYIQLNSQTAFQTRTISTTFDAYDLNQTKFEGGTFVPVLPSAYLAYKKGKFVVSAGFNYIGGGGSAEFKKGLPSFEEMIAGIVPSSAALGVNAYSADVYFKGTSGYAGIQAGVAYKISDAISVGLGGRYVMIKNKYEGHIQDLMFNPGGGALTNAYTFFTTQAAALQPGVDGTGNLVTNNAGAYTFAQVEGAGYITAAQRAQLEGGLLALGYPQTSIDAMTISTANTIYKGAQTQMNGGAAQTSDKIVEAEQTGSGFTPIVSVDLSLLEGKLGIALKYEHLTKMEVKNKTTRDDVGMFPNDSTTTADLPGFLSVGVRYNATDKLKVQAGFHYYMDKAARYGVRDDNGDFCTNGTEVTDPFDGTKKPYIKSNSTEFALGLEYAITEKFGASAGYLYASTNPNNVYQSDMNYSLKSSTVGFGVFAKATEKLNIDLGFSYTMYQDYTKPFGAGGVTAYSDTYKKSATLIALGLDYRFGK